jgi:hypothetical protein
MEPRRYRPAKGITQLVGTVGLSATLGVTILAPATDQIMRRWSEPRLLVHGIPLSQEGHEQSHTPGTLYQTLWDSSGSNVSMTVQRAYPAPELPLTWEVAKLTETLHTDDNVPAFIIRLRSA